MAHSDPGYRIGAEDHRVVQALPFGAVQPSFDGIQIDERLQRRRVLGSDQLIGVEILLIPNYSPTF